MHASIKKIGNSSGVLIPKPMLTQLGAVPGDTVDISFSDGRLIIEFARPRAGWAEDAKKLAASGDDALVWPEFANEGDSELQW
jgi:antitoxin MazE